MTFSPLADTGRRIADGGRSQPRQSAITGFGIHHNAGVDAYPEAWNPNREVSANYWIANDGTIIPNIDESRRAFTSGMAGYPAGAAADHRNITVEVSNSPDGVRRGTWAISDAAMGSLIALIADVWQRYGLGLVERGVSRGLGVHQDWVPTSCPGPYILGHLPDIITSANNIITGFIPEPEPTQGEDEMSKPLIAQKLDGGPMNTLGVMIEPDGTVVALDIAQWEFWRDRVGCVPVECKNPGHWEYLMGVMAKRRARANVVISDAELKRITAAIRDSAVAASSEVTAQEVAKLLQITVG